MNIDIKAVTKISSSLNNISGKNIFSLIEFKFEVTSPFAPTRKIFLFLVFVKIKIRAYVNGYLDSTLLTSCVVRTNKSPCSYPLTFDQKNPHKKQTKKTKTH